MKTFPAIKVIMITGADTNVYAIEAIEMGIHGYIHKGISTDLLTTAITSVFNNSHWYDPIVSQQILPILLGEKIKDPIHRLSNLELDIAVKIGRGYDHADIMQVLKLSRTSFYRHVNSLYRKLGIENDVMLALRLVELGIVDKDGLLPSRNE